MVIIVYIALICYMPIFANILPATDFGAGIPDMGPVRLFNYLLFLVFMIRWGVTREVRLFHKWIAILAIFYIIVFASVSWSNYSYNSFIFQELFNTVFMPLFIATVGMNLFGQEDNSKLYVKHIILSSLILSLISIFQFVIGILAVEEEIRSYGTFSNPNLLAIFLVLTIPCLMYGIEKELIPRVLGWVVCIFVISGILCTGSRKGTVTMILCFFIYNFVKKRYKRAAYLSVGFSILVISIFRLGLISDRFQPEKIQYELQGKWNMTYVGWKMFQTSPIIGLGYEGYYENFGKYFPYSEKRKYDAHNIFITALTNYGLVGIIPFMGIFLYPVFLSAKILRLKGKIISNEYSRDMAVICLSSVILFMVSGWFAGGLFYLPVITYLLYTNISLFCARI